MITLSLFITLVAFYFAKKINYWILLINIILVLVNFFFLFSRLGEWYFCMPVLIYTIFILILLSYEMKMLTDIGDFLSMLEGDLTRLTLSSLSLTQATLYQSTRISTWRTGEKNNWLSTLNKRIRSK